jgi:hypothetical protein
MSTPENILNIVTAVSRPKNLPAILRSMNGAEGIANLKVRWLVVYDDPPKKPDQIEVIQSTPSPVEVVPLQWTGGPCRLGIKQKNYGIDHCLPGYYHLLDDDNKMHPAFFKRISEVILENPGKMAFGFNQRRWDQHGDLRATPEKMFPGSMDNSMFVVRTEFIGPKRYDIKHAGCEDGWFFHELYKQDPSAWLFVNEFLAYFNYFQKFPFEVLG